MQTVTVAAGKAGASRRGTLAGIMASALQTESRLSAAVVRIVLGIVMFPHGAQHALGWFGGYGFVGTLHWMSGPLGFPAPLAVVAIVTELIAPAALVVGFAARAAALGVLAIMAGAVLVHAPNGFFMNWFGQLPAAAEGFEYHLLVLAMAFAIVVEGGGALSLDRLLSRRGEVRG